MDRDLLSGVTVAAALTGAVLAAAQHNWPAFGWALAAGALAANNWGRVVR